MGPTGASARAEQATTAAEAVASTVVESVVDGCEDRHQGVSGPLSSSLAFQRWWRSLSSRFFPRISFLIFL